MSERNLLGPVVVGLVAAGAGALLMMQRVWATGAVESGGAMASSELTVTGTTAHPGATGFAIVIAASALGVLAVPAKARRLLGVLIAACAAVSIGYLVGGADRMAAAKSLAEQTAVVGAAPSSWDQGSAQYAAMAAFVVAFVLGVLVAWWGPRWPAMGRQYEAPSGASVDDDPWKALDEGRDPTE